ncbi:MAG: LapA family protein [Lysobacter sp.]|nr:LapA family protein [Lysobacter sp.]MDQ3268829.1 LapA family protein [Pseudomonadota bacterium]
MRFIRFLVALACLLAGAALGALNRDPVSIDLGIVAIATSTGVALLTALLMGVLIAGLVVSASVVLPLKRRLSRLERQARAPIPADGG